MQKNLDSDASDISSPHESDGTECRYERGTHSVNITSGHAAGYGGAPSSQQSSPSPSLNGPNRCPTPLSSGGSGNPNYAGFREHIKSKATLAETFMKNLNRNNNNNNSSNNYNHLGGSNGSLNLTEADSNSFAILQANSKKMLDSARKQHKYLAKRKILMHYNTELGGEKRLKEMERDRYPSAEQHDDALNNNHSHAQDNIMEPIITTIVPQTPPPSTHNNNFKIRLVESHHLTNNSNSNQNQSSNNNNSSSSPQSNDCNNDEEALNLVQIPNANGSRNREATPTCATPTPDIQLIKREVKTELSPAENLSNNNGHDDEMAGAGYDRKYDDNNNNSGLDMETDSNNNNSKPGGDNNNGLALALGKHKLLSAINRNIEQDHPDHEHQDQQDREADHGGNNCNSDDNNNNNHSQHLDLSTIKNIATAEILCGLKSKVLKLEEEQRERERERERKREACRSLSEIKNAE